MKILDNYTVPKLLLVSLACAAIVAYPNIVCIPWELHFTDESKYLTYWLYFGFRYIYFALVFWCLLYQNLNKLKNAKLKTRTLRTFLIAVPAYAIYVLIWSSYGSKAEFFSTITCQFFVMAVISIVAGYIYYMYNMQRKKEQEIEQLKTENLQSRYDALMNQINPHFFFNSLSGLTSLIKKKNDDNTMTYVNKMSDVFRYILQSDKKGLVTLEEELEFVQAFRYMMEVRFANKLQFNVDVADEALSYKLPVLSILPLIENVVAHNTIDSDNKMVVTIRLNEQNELVVFNPRHPKLSPAETNGTGLINLNNRFLLLINKPIRIDDNENFFSVYLPLIV